MKRHILSLKDRGIAHVGLKVSDLARSREFYREILGLADQTKQPNVSSIRCGSDTLVIYEENGGSSGFHFGFRLDSPSQVDEWLDWIRSKNISIYDDISKPGHPRSFKFQDPDGHLIEISSKT